MRIVTHWKLFLLLAMLANPLSAADETSENCCGKENLAFQKPVRAKSSQNGRDPKFLTDGRLDTRWCASGAQRNEWVEVDFEKPVDLQAIRLHWENRTGAAYQYRVEVSKDGQDWQEIVDASKHKKPNGVAAHDVDAKGVQFLRVHFLDGPAGQWGSLWELEASAGPVADLPVLKEPRKPTPPAASVADVKVVAGFDVSIFAAPPKVSYPVCLTTSANGEVFVGVDEQGSLGKDSGGGRVLRCRDTDGDGVADEINTFAEMEHPRGLVYDNGSLWVLHPPFLTVYHDTDGDGTSDSSDRLITGISTDEVNRRGADHTTNGIRMGIDGWIYIAVGDFGFTKAVAKDGTTLSRRGGGVVRIRPDGSGMEIFAWGLRNILDVSIDPLMNLFTRDNTNDGGGWDVRVSHIMQTANYGYPSLYINFTEEAMPPLGDYGGGSGCGTMFFQDARWPAGHNDLLLTCDWGRSVVYSHNLAAQGATFGPQQDTFVSLPRPTDIDVDPSGRMYVSSWKNGGYSFSDPNVGFVAQLVPTGYQPVAMPDVHALSAAELVSQLDHPSAAWRFTAQREWLRRAENDQAGMLPGLVALATNEQATLYGQVAAVMTLGQLEPAIAQPHLLPLLKFDVLRAAVVRALTDRQQSAALAPAEPILAALSDADPQVQASAIIAIGRIYEFASPERKQSLKLIWQQASQRLLEMTEVDESQQSAEAGDWRAARPERVLPHLAAAALVRLQAVDVCLEGLNGPYHDGALWALRGMHKTEVVDGLFTHLSQTSDPQKRRDAWTALIRLCHEEGPFEKGWWGTRPDTTGPYYSRQTWQQSKRIEDAIREALASAPQSMVDHLQEQLKRHLVVLDSVGENVQEMREEEQAIKLPPVDPNDPNQIGNQAYADILKKTLAEQGDAAAGKVFFTTQSCINCHTFANGQQPKGPHLVDIGKRYNKTELIESIVQPSKKLAQGFDTWAFLLTDGSLQTGFVVLESAETVTIRQDNGVSVEILQDDIEERIKRELSMMPKGVVDNLTPKQLADLVAYLQSLR